jgi:hypothetical protein
MNDNAGWGPLSGWRLRGQDTPLRMRFSKERRARLGPAFVTMDFATDPMRRADFHALKAFLQSN